MITSKDSRFIDIARKMSLKSSHSRYLLSAILVRGSRILSIGINKDNAAIKPYIRKTRPNINLHAEVDCLAGITKDQSYKTTLYITGYTAAGNNLKSSRPCTSCLGFIEAMKVKKVVYTEEGEIKELII